MLPKDCEDENFLQNNFRNIMKLVKEWSPAAFNREMRLEYLKDNAMLKDASLTEEYFNLVDLDVNNWWLTFNQLNLNNLTGSEILYNVVKDDKKYISVKQLTVSWSSPAIEFVCPTMPEDHIGVEKHDVQNTDVKTDQETNEEYVSDDHVSLDEPVSNNDQDCFFDCPADSFVEDSVIFQYDEEKRKSSHKSAGFKIIPSGTVSKSCKPIIKIFTPLSLNANVNSEFQNSSFNSEFFKVENLKQELKNINESQVEIEEAVESNICNTNNTVFDLDSYTVEPSIEIANEPTSVLDEKENYLNIEREIESTNCLADAYSILTLDLKMVPVDTGNSKSVEGEKEFSDFIAKGYQDETNRSDECLYKIKLFDKYRYRRFFGSKSRNSLFRLDKRPTVEDWNNFLASLVQNDVLSKVRQNNSFYYRFNVRAIATGRYLKDDFLKNFLKINLNNRRKETAGSLKKYFQVISGLKLKVGKISYLIWL